jgi:S-adenosylmethionine hydrolase
MSRPVISFLSDFGPSAPAVCRGVMFSILPDANIIDVSHQVPRYSIRDGSASLSFALPYLAVGVHVGVVDPGVGTERRPIGIRTKRGVILIGPDHGLLVRAAEKLGGIVEVRALENPELMRPEVSTSFHGRDLFAPMAAHLAGGVPFERVGHEVPAADLVRIRIPEPVIEDGRLRSEIVHIMIYGNVTLAGRPADLEAAIGPLDSGRALRLTFLPKGTERSVVEDTVWGRTFGSVPIGASVLFADSEGNLCLADNQGDAAKRLGLAVDRPVVVTAR